MAYYIMKDGKKVLVHQTQSALSAEEQKGIDEKRDHQLLVDGLTDYLSHLENKPKLSDLKKVDRFQKVTRAMLDDAWKASTKETS